MSSKTKNLNLILNVKEMNLIKESETTKDKQVYGNLYSALKYYDTLSYHECETSSYLDTKAKASLLSGKSSILKKIKDEWYACDCYDSVKRIPCSLCNTPNKKIYYIKNRLNNKKMNVGSDCILQFDDLENYSSVKSSYNEKKAIREQDIRRTKFGELELEEPNFVKNAANKYIKLDIMLPFELNNNIKQTLINLNLIKTEYIKKGGDIKAVSFRYNDLKKEFKVYWTQAIEFYKANRRKKLICDKYMSVWLEETNREMWETVSKNNGLFTEETLKYAHCDYYMDKNIKSFRRCLKDDAVKLLSVNSNVMHFVFSGEKYHKPVSFYIPNKVFMETNGRYCLTSTKYTFNRYNLIGLILDRTMNNFDSLHHRMFGIFDHREFDIEYDYNTKYIYLKGIPYSSNNVESKFMYLRITEDFIYNLFGVLLFANDNVIYNKISDWYNILKNRNTWITIQEKESRSRIASEAAALQRQKEFY